MDYTNYSKEQGDIMNITPMQYCEYVISHNPTKKVFPMTHKNSHGIELDTWLNCLTSMGYSAGIEKYDHHDGTAFVQRLRIVILEEP